MNATSVVLDCAALSDLADGETQRPSSITRAILRVAWERGHHVLVPAVVCAEACRGQARTRAVEALLARHAPDRHQSKPIRVVDTDFEMARVVGTVLFSGSAGSEDLVDAHLVSICINRGGGVILTSDPSDLVRLSAPFLGVKIFVRKI
jgi:predicted nucleic acid-binding protein